MNFIKLSIMNINSCVLAAIATFALVSCETELPPEPEKVSENFMFLDIEYPKKGGCAEYIVKNVGPVTFYNNGPAEQKYTFDTRDLTREWYHFRSDDVRAFDFAGERPKVRIPGESSETGIVYVNIDTWWDYLPGEQSRRPSVGGATTFDVKPFHKIETTASFTYKKIEAPYLLRLQGVEFGEVIEIEGRWSGMYLHSWESDHTIEEIQR